MKKILAFLLSIIILLASCLTMSSCSNNNATIKMGQWLSLLDDAFGMKSYVNEEPYFKNIKKGDPYFDAVQTAAEWDIIDGDTIETNKSLTWNEAIITLVNAGNFIKESSSSEEKFQYGIEKFGNNLKKYWKNRNINYNDAIVLLGNVQNLWANKTYDKPVEELKYKDNVKNLANDDSVINYKEEENIVIIPNAQDINLNAGDTYILPATKNNPGEKAYKVKSISTEDNNLIITNDDVEPELEDIVEDIYVQETIEPNANNSVIYDGNGNRITNEISVQPQRNDSVNKQNDIVLLSNTNTPNVINLSSKISHKFNVGDWNIGLTYSLGDSLGLEATVGKGEDETGKWEVGFGIDNFKVTNEIDYKFFKLKSASVRVDYDAKLKFKTEIKDKIVNKVCAPYNNGNGQGLTNLKKAAFKDAKKAGGNGAQTIKICSIDVWSVGVARVCLDVNFTVEVDGTFSITLTSHDSKGVEYKNNNIRFINTNDKEVDVQAQAKIEATLGIGPALYTIGLKKPIIGIQAKVGAGAAASVTLHLVDPEEHLIEEAVASDMPPEVYQSFVDADITTDVESIMRAAQEQGGTYTSETNSGIKLHADVCIDVALYMIVKIQVTDTSYAADLLGGKITLSYEFLGEKNGKFARAHIENFDFISGFSNIAFGSAANAKDMCTKSYKKFAEGTEGKKDEKKDDEQTKDDTIIKGDQIILSEIRVSISEGQKYYPTVQVIPKGYEISDIKIEVSDNRIAKVNKDGSITGISSGSTTIKVFTSDKKFSAYIGLNVESKNATKFTKLS